MTDTVLLTGISGFIAKHVALRFLQAGYAVRGTLRRLDRADEVRAALRGAGMDDATLARLTFVAADLESDAGWADAMAGVQGVIHTASPFPIAEPKDPNDLIRPAVDGTARVLNAAADAGVMRVVLTSSVVAISDDSKPYPQTEENWCDPASPTTSAYGASKTLAEKRAWEIAAARGLKLTTINPGLVVGPPLDEHYGSSLSVVERILRGKDPMMPDLTFSLVDVRDVAEMHLRAFQRETTTGRRYAATAGVMSMVDMGRALKAAYPVRRIPTMQAPTFVVRFLALFDADIRGILPRLGLREEVVNNRAVAEMGMGFIPTRQAVLDAADWLVRHGKAWIVKPA